VKCDIAMPCATQNELDENDAQNLVNNGCIGVCEVANMPCTPEAVEIIQRNGLLFAPGKAANAGGVGVSGLEMTQNAMKLHWPAEEVDKRLHQIMGAIHSSCVKHGKRPDGYIDYVKGANIAGFLKVANTMLDHGII
jgi:glutamate dehydrogenase (NADP+)